MKNGKMLLVVLLVAIQFLCLKTSSAALGVFNAFGQVEYPPLPQHQSLDDVTKSKVLSAFGKLPLHFVANRGQFDPSVVYYAKSEGATVFCTEQGLVFGFAEGSITLKFSENRPVKPEARSELKGKVNYFIGNDPALWRTDIPTFQEVVYREVYPGIDLVYSGNQRRLKYTFYVQPGADPNQIQMIYDGIEGVWVDDTTGELVIQTPWGEMRDAAPVAYQEIEGVRKKIDISFRLMGEKRVGFAIGDNYDQNFMLALDPGYSTYLGGSDHDYGRGIAVDNNGNAYVTGFTFSSDFPTQNPYQGTNQGSMVGMDNVFVTKLSINGNTLIYSTYLGGHGSDRGYCIAVDSEGNAYVTGIASSYDFPTQNPYQSTKAGWDDAFVTKLSSSGNTLIYSTYLGGDGYDDGWGIVVDSEGNAYVTGRTASTDFPTQNPLQGSNAGWDDAFVSKLSNSGNTLIYSTYLGGSGFDKGCGIAVGSLGNPYITGRTTSSNFPTANPFQASFGGGDSDAFVTKLSSLGNTLSYSTYLGGSGSYESGYGIAVDASGYAYVTGCTASTNFPITNAYQSSIAGGRDAFVTKLSSLGNTLIYSTYLGGSDDYESGNSIAVDSLDNAYVTGYTISSDFPTQNPYQGSNAGIYDAFVTKLSSIGNTLIYSTYLGGSGRDYGYGISVDSEGNVYVIGETQSSDLPILNPYQSSHGGGTDDAFVAKLAKPPQVIHVATTGNDETGDGSEENPYATIHRAFEVVSANDTVLVWPGMYSFGSRIDWPNVDGIVLKSKCGPACTILDANNSNRHFYISGSNIGSNTKISGFTFQRGYDGTGSGGSIWIENGAAPVIEHNVFRDNHAGDNGGALFFGTGYVGSVPMVCFNIFDSNEAKYGGAIGGAAVVSDWEVDVNSNIFINNIDSDPNNRAIHFWEGRCNVDYNLFYNNIPGSSGVVLGSGNLMNTDPKFVDYTNHDYHLLPTSPCIDAGDPNFDYSNELEPNGNRVNIGVYGNTAEAAITLPMVGDVSGNKQITAYDAALILQYCVGLISEFPIESMLIAQNAVPAEYTVSIPNQTARAGETIFVPIQINNASVVAGGMTLHYDTDTLRAKEVSNTISGVYWKSNITDDQIRIAFAQVNPTVGRKTLANSEQSLTNIFYIKFDVIDGTSGRESLISFDEVKFAESLSITLRNGTVTVLPEKSILLQNYPNPFNPDTWVPYKLATDSHITIRIYNTKGQLVRTLYFGNQKAGIYVTKDRAAYWDGRSSFGEKVASGVYYYTLQAGEFRAMRKMVILK